MVSDIGKVIVGRSVNRDYIGDSNMSGTMSEAELHDRYRADTGLDVMSEIDGHVMYSAAYVRWVELHLLPKLFNCSDYEPYI